MTTPRRLWFVLLSTMLLGASPRPNALDAAVNALSNATLLAHPASGLVDAARAAAADRLLHLMLPGWFVTFALQIVIFVYFWQSGLAARVRDQLRRRFSNDWTVRFFYGAVLGLIGRVAAIIPEFYIYRVERSMGLSDQLLRAWGTDWIANTVVTMLVVGLVVAIVLWLVDRTQLWYVYMIVAIIAASIVLVFAQPYIVLPRFGHYVNLPPAVARDAAILEDKANVHVPILLLADDRSHLESAVVNGLGPSQRIVITDAVIQAETPAEIRYTIARELGYIGAGGPLRVAFFDGIFVILGIALAVAVADRIGFRRDDDPIARLALVGALLGLMYLLIVPFDNAMLRAISTETEKYALSLTGDKAAAVRSIVRGADQRLENVCVTGSAELFRQQVLDPARAVELANGIPSGCK